MKKGTVHLCSAHSMARPARPCGPAPLGHFGPWLKKQGRAAVARGGGGTGRFRRAGGEREWGSKPRRTPAARGSDFGWWKEGKLTVSSSPRQRGSSGGVHRWGVGVALINEKGEFGEVSQGSMVLRKVKMRPGLGRRGLAPGRSSRPRKEIGGRGAKQRAGVRRSRGRGDASPSDHGSAR
jgi:hypothetical protein